MLLSAMFIIHFFLKSGFTVTVLDIYIVLQLHSSFNLPPAGEVMQHSDHTG